MGASEHYGAVYAACAAMNAGDMTADAFQRYYPRAEAYLSSITQGRTDSILQKAGDEDFMTADSLNGKVLLTAMILTEELRRLDLNDGAGPVVAATNDGISVTYAGGRSSGLFANNTGSSSASTQQRLYQTAALYLRGTGLLYRGIR